MPEFVHLHLHSEGSLLDGMCRTKPLLKRAVQQNMPAVAITDHGVMYKCIEFYKSAKDSGVKPILGCEVYVSPNSRFEKAGKGGGGSNYYHLILLAKDLEGYKNLMRLVSVGHLEGFYYKPRVDRETLARYSKGLVCLSACLGAEVPQLIVQGKMEQARLAAAEHLEIFGRENYYFELQDHGIKDQYRVNEALLEMSRSMDIPLVATNDVHYVCAEDHLAHDLLLCIQTGATLTDAKRFKFESDQFYLASAEEMAQKFSNHPEALANTLRVAEMCNVNLNFDQVSLPQFPVPEGFTPETHLLDLCRKALPDRFPNASDEHIRRLDYELSVINPKGFASYFLIVSDFVRHAQEQGISVRARGSAAGSIVAYLLGITNVDPLRYTLMFERFLNPDRVEMPDIDLDFADTRRDEMIEYAIGRYGRDHVAQIGTLGTLGARAAIRDAGRALNVPLPEVDRIAKLIQGLSPSIDDSIQSIPEMQKLYEGSPDVRTLIDRARTVEGVVRSSGIHAAGVVISSDPLTDCVPLQRGGKDGWPCTQYDMDSVSKIGLLKVDFLGLRNLTVVDNCVEMIRRRGRPDFDLDQIPEDDAATFAMLSEGHGIGVFQLESSGMRQMIRQLKPRIFDDLVPVVALYRPGPLQSGMVEQFIECRHGRRQVTYLDERLVPILQDTYGVMLYQEQILQISMQLGGFTPGDAEKLRKAMSKKIADLMDTYRGKFVSGAVAKGIKQDVAGVIYDQMAAFAAYGFNKAHSAAYGALAYETAYLKANYSVEYMSALLTSLMENKDRLASTIEECRRMNIDVLPPDVNRSMVDFAPEPNSDRGVRFGLAAIKGLSPNAIEGILRIRQEGGPFLSIFDFCERAHEVDGLNKGNLEALIKAGAFLQITPNRRQLIDNLEVALSLRQQARRNAQSGQVTLFGLLGAAAESVTPQVHYPELRPTEEFKPQEILAFEKDLLGLYVTSHPLHGYREAFRKASAVSTSDLKQFNDRDPVTVAGIVCEFRHHQTKKGDPMMFVTIEDLAGRVDVVVFKEALTKHGEHIDRERVIIIRGKVSVRVGTGSRGRKGAPAAEESDEREYSVLADEITAAQVSTSDLDPWGEPQSPAGPTETGEGPWAFDDGSVIEWGSPETEGEAELHWSTRSLLGLDLESGPTGEQPGISDVRPQRIHLEQGRGGEAPLPKVNTETLASSTGSPSAASASAANASAANASAANASAASAAPADDSVDGAPAGPPAADAPLESPEFAAASEPAAVDLDDVSTIRDIYGVLPKKGEKIVLYPSPGSTAEPTYNASPRRADAVASPSVSPAPAASPAPTAASERGRHIAAETPPIIKEGPAKAKTLHIQLTPQQSNRAALKELAELLERYKGGPHPVELVVETPEGQRIIRSNGTGGVQPSVELVQTLKERFGTRNVRVA